MSVESAIALLPETARIFVQGGAATPNLLLGELARQASRFRGASLVHLHTEGPALYAAEPLRESFRIVNLFVGANLRRQLDYERVDYLPCFLSEIPALFRGGAIPLDAAILHVSPPDKAGYCSLGVSVDIACAAAASARLLIAQVNPRMPRVHGDGLLPASSFHALVGCDEPIPELIPGAPSAEERAIARHIAPLVEDGATLQMGIGAVPDAVARELHDRRRLGLHTEMWSDGALSLIEKGALTNEDKGVHRGKCVSGFLMGSRRLYDFVDDNPAVIQLGIDYVNSPVTIARNPKVVAINSALEIDLTGQVCADSLGHRVLSGVGGQMDFMRGAALSPGGRPVIALESRTRKGEPKIVSALRPGAGVVTTRAHVHYVATEHGLAFLHGKTIGERARALVAIAHPGDRERLEREFREAHGRSS